MRGELGLLVHHMVSGVPQQGPVVGVEERLLRAPGKDIVMPGTRQDGTRYA